MQTIGDAIRLILPSGSNPIGFFSGGPSWNTCPIYPPDLFAVSGKLIDLSGAYHHVHPCEMPLHRPGDRLVRITNSDVDWADRNAKAWRQNGQAQPVPKAVENEWAALKKHWGSPLFDMMAVTDAAPKWWKAAVRLLMVADQASAGLGFGEARDPSNQEGSWISELWRELMPPKDPAEIDGSLQHARSRGIWSYSKADPDVVCVLPKVRTSPVGCTMRSLSHNLALLPPRGVARVWWLAPTSDSPNTAGALNVVLIPYPYSISSRCFVAKNINKRHGWGWFDVDQRWLRPTGIDAAQARDEIAEYLVSIVEAAAADMGEIHGLVMPEMALDYDLFEAVAYRLGRSTVRKDIEFFMCGTSGNARREGNFACTATFLRLPDDDLEVCAFPLFDDRQKHHRWRLDRYQISRYGLTSALDPKYLWWEELPIYSRSLSMQQIRGSSVLTAMICEDLARVDPCQEALRSIGPDLIFALLMDGPQLRSRWPGRYATVLAEDPGSSVLTMTSLGLISRANESGSDPASQVIALWKDLEIDRREIRLEPGSSGVCITLNVSEQEEFTLDGRSDDRSAPVWTLGSVRQIARTDIQNVPAWIDRCP